MKNNNELPWVSICIATYKRKEMLFETLNCIKNQTFLNFEVVVTDNDPDKSSFSVIEDLNDKRFKYFYNLENIGMVKNFNSALGKANGEFIVMMADDDHPTVDFLQTMFDLWIQNPNYGAYYGACEIIISNLNAARAYDITIGTRNCLSNFPVNTIRPFSKESFPIEFFNYNVFPYMLWSTGVVRKDIVLNIGGMPDYGSPLLTDLSYIAVTGSVEGCLTINKVLGKQIIHGSNSGFTDPHDIEIALVGCDKYIENKLSNRNDWNILKKKMRKFLAIYISNHTIAMSTFLNNKSQVVENLELKNTLNRIFEIPNFNMRYFYYRTKYLPVIAKLFYPILPFYKLVKKLFS